MSRPVSPLLPSTTPNPGPPKFRPRAAPSRLYTQPSIRVLFYFVCLFLFAIIYGRNHFYRDPGSIFFDPTLAYTRWYSAHRENEAKEYIQAAAFTADGRDEFDAADYKKAFTNATICAAIPTVSRDVDTHYVETTIGSMLQGLSEDERADLNLQIFFATAHPSNHSTFSKPWLRDVTDRVYTYEEIVPQAAFTKLAELEDKHDLFTKSVQDYTLALQQCYENTTAPYIAVFEDDILVAEGWLPRIRLAVKDLVHQMRKDTTRFDDSWLYLRLFNQERSTGWGSARVGGNHEFLICLIIGAVFWAAMKLIKTRSTTMRTHVDNYTVAVVCLLIIPSSVILFFKTGKASLLPPRAGVREEDFGCCSQGLLFNRQHVPELVKYLRDKGTGQYDMMTMDFAKEKKLAMYSLYPMIVQHIGLTSAKGTEDQESRQIWSMAFEDFDPRKVHDEHLRLMGEVYAKDPMEPVIQPDFAQYHYPNEPSKDDDE